MEQVRVRFAPSPTGPLHIGGARSALFNFLLARKFGGSLILRVEDTDLERSSRESEENIMASLRWLGIDWDEGPDKGGPYAPYRQTERLDIYRQYVDRLLAAGHGYCCYCTEEELEAERQELMARGDLPRYLGKCRDLTPGERQELERQGRRPVIRFRVPEGRTVTVDDMVRGQVSFETDGIGDFVIVKSDGIPTYNFAVVVDDAAMRVSHVIRAEEHLSNTPRQLLIYQALGLPVPRFAHISLILGKDRTKMSKRHGATSVVQYQELGYLPEALVNFLALLGWAPEGEQEIFGMDELIKEFSLERVAKNPAVFDMDKLDWINGYYIRMTPVERLAEMAIPHLQAAGHVPVDVTLETRRKVEQVVAAVQRYLTHMSQITEFAPLFFADEVEIDPEAAEVLGEEQVPRVLELFREKLTAAEALEPDGVKALLKSITKELKIGGRQVFMPVRAAVTGQVHGPELHDIIPILGRERVLNRVNAALGKM
ncbi:glutamyl-tRNA synthetase [Clostridiales bacterium PH28_bin88]|nr:glutamyl-tRNA synthetase [Clostridiales bacterium PH28_bin88]